MKGIRFIHTADWQIGKPFRNFGEKDSVLRQARLNAIETIGRLAVSENALHVLVAGDVFDSETPSQRTLLEPLERMRRFPGVAWLIISGNHDPHRPYGLWERVKTQGVPENVHLALEARPINLSPAVVLLPSPMRRKTEAEDLTTWMDEEPTAPGVMRIGLAHGSVTGFDASGEAKNPISPSRAKTAGLDYLALGDWHRTMEIAPATWYAGTPEPDRFDSQEIGKALLVDIAGAGVPARVTASPTGTFTWRSVAAEISDVADLEFLERKLRELRDLHSSLVRLKIGGSLALAGRSDLDRRLESLEAAMLYLDVNMSDFHVRPTISDLEQIDFGGVLRESASTLKTIIDDTGRTAAERRQAEDALVELYLMTSSMPLVEPGE